MNLICVEMVKGVWLQPNLKCFKIKDTSWGVFFSVVHWENKVFLQQTQD